MVAIGESFSPAGTRAQPDRRNRGPAVRRRAAEVASGLSATERETPQGCGVARADDPARFGLRNAGWAWSPRTRWGLPGPLRRYNRASMMVFLLARTQALAARAATTSHPRATPDRCDRCVRHGSSQAVADARRCPVAGGAEPTRAQLGEPRTHGCQPRPVPAAVPMLVPQRHPCAAWSQVCQRHMKVQAPGWSSIPAAMSERDRLNPGRPIAQCRESHRRGDLQPYQRSMGLQESGAGPPPLVPGKR